MGIFMFWGDLRRVTWFGLKWAKLEWAKSKHLKAVFPADWCHQLPRNIQVNEGLGGMCHCKYQELNVFKPFEVLWRSQTHSKSLTHTIHCFLWMHFSPLKYFKGIKCIQSPLHTHTIHCFLWIHFSPSKYFEDIKCIRSTLEGWNTFKVTYTHNENTHLEKYSSDSNINSMVIL